MSNKRKADSPPLTSAKQSKNTMDAFHEALTLLEDTSVVPSTSATTAEDSLIIGLSADKHMNIVEPDDDAELESALQRGMEDAPTPKPTAGPSGNNESAAQTSDDIGPMTSEEEELNRIRMRMLMANFSADQLDRYEAMRRASFPKSVVKRNWVSSIVGRCYDVLSGKFFQLINRFGNTVVNNNVVIAMAGLAKVFTGELVEEALDIQEKAGESGALTPRHLTLAYANLNRNGKLFPVRPRCNPLARPNAML